MIKCDCYLSVQNNNFEILLTHIIAKLLWSENLKNARRVMKDVYQSLKLYYY